MPGFQSRSVNATPVWLADDDGNPITIGGGGGGGDASAANQTTEIARLTSIRDAVGAAADASASSDTGTFSLIALFKRSLTFLSSLAGTVVNGALDVRQSSLLAGTDRSGTATTTSGGLTVAANTARRGLVGQNVSAVNIGFNEHGGTAAIGSAGTYTVAAGQSFAISTNKAVNFIAASGTAAITLTEY